MREVPEPPDPIDGFEWVRASDLRERLTFKEKLALYANPERPHDKVINRKRWVATPISAEEHLDA